MILEYVADRRMVRNIAIDVNSVDPRSRSDSLIDKGEQEKRLECNENESPLRVIEQTREPESNPKGEKGGGSPPCIGEAGIIYTDSKLQSIKN